MGVELPTPFEHLDVLFFPLFGVHSNLWFRLRFGFRRLWTGRRALKPGKPRFQSRNL